MASRAEQKQQARASRLAAEADAARAAARHRNLMLLGAVIAVAIVVVLGAVAISHHGGSSATSGTGAQKSALVARQFAGLPQHGSVIGDPKAQFTLVEFADLQCPVCQRYTLDVMPSVISRYVRTGKIKMDLKLRTFIGPDSVKAAGVAAAAAQQSRIWPFADLFYHNQGEENSGYVTPAFLTKIAAGTPGLNGNRALAQADLPAAQRKINADESLANSLQSNQTPDFFIRRGGGPLEPVTPSGLTPQAMSAAIDKAIGT
jgi:protein-disulfide isomerase